MRASPYMSCLERVKKCANTCQAAQSSLVDKAACSVQTGQRICGGSRQVQRQAGPDLPVVQYTVCKDLHTTKLVMDMRQWLERKEHPWVPSSEFARHGAGSGLRKHEPSAAGRTAHAAVTGNTNFSGLIQQKTNDMFLGSSKIGKSRSLKPLRGMAASMRAKAEACGNSSDGLHGRPSWLHKSIERKKNPYTGEIWFEFDGSRFLTPQQAQAYFDTLNAAMAQHDGAHRASWPSAQTSDAASAFPTAPDQSTSLRSSASELHSGQLASAINRASVDSSSPARVSRGGVRRGGGARVFSPDSSAAPTAPTAPLSPPSRLPAPAHGGSALAAMAATRSAQAVINRAMQAPRLPRPPEASHSAGNTQHAWPVAPPTTQASDGPTQITVCASPPPAPGVQTSVHSTASPASRHSGTEQGPALKNLGELLAGEVSSDASSDGGGSCAGPATLRSAEHALASGDSDHLSADSLLEASESVHMPAAADSSGSSAASPPAAQKAPAPQSHSHSHSHSSAHGSEGSGSWSSGSHSDRAAPDAPPLAALMAELADLRGAFQRQEAALQRMGSASSTEATPSAQDGAQHSEGGAAAPAAGAAHTADRDMSHRWTPDDPLSDAVCVVTQRSFPWPTLLKQQALKPPSEKEAERASLLEQIHRAMSSLGSEEDLYGLLQRVQGEPVKGGKKNAKRRRRKKKSRTSSKRGSNSSGSGSGSNRLPSVVTASTACQPSVAASGRGGSHRPTSGSRRKSAAKAKASKR